jgi:hypothetical protein
MQKIIPCKELHIKVKKTQKKPYLRAAVHKVAKTLKNAVKEMPVW